MATTPTLVSTLFLLLCFPFLIMPTEIYHPDDLYIINCGSSNSFPYDGRNWTGDINTKFLLEPQKGASSSLAANALQRNTNGGPYTSARLSYSQFTYSFPITTAGPKFIRLFFYPTSYQNFDLTKAYFSVKSGEYTLLKDFNASLYAGAFYDNSSGTFYREYSVNVQDVLHKNLNITFIPSTPTDNAKDPFYAFINGIEVVSMPPYLYYTEPDDIGFQFLGNENQFRVESNTALETTYRFNVGGTTISSSNDTGMLRRWEADDAKYVTSNSELASEYGKETPLRFNNQTPAYTAPSELYRTLRHMGENATINLGFNLTWEFPIDSGFTYMLRLHFCELDPNVQQAGDRRFFIYIQDQMVEDDADVLLWTSGQRATPIVKNYAMTVQPGNQKNAKITLKMSTLPESFYADAVLNGLELFKISNPQASLAGPNPDPPPSPSTSHVPLQKKSNNKTLATIATVVGAVSSLSLLFLVAFVAFFLIKRQKKNHERYNDSKHKSEGSSPLPTNLCRHFSIEEIRAATNNFDEVFIVGVGGFGNVYKGYTDDGATPVAIKRLKPGSQQGAHEFMNEIEMLSQLRHLHLVSLIGYCYESNEMILVYDFMTRGTLRDHLYDTDNPSLSWKQRLEICIGAARGLHYLHTGAKHMIIHRDVKSTNILLDEKWVAKVSDFGLSRVGPIGTSMTHVSTVVKGSIGYLDPEYYKRQRLTEKSDVYSFGVVLLEVLCGRPPLLRSVEKRQVSLVDWARKCYEGGTIGEMVDPKVKGEIAAECLRTFGEIALKCLMDDGSKRPSMNDVVGVLEFVLQLQENAAIVKEERWNREESDEMFSSTSVSDKSKSSASGISMSSSESGDHHSFKSMESKWLMFHNVFSEIADPKGR